MRRLYSFPLRHLFVWPPGALLVLVCAVLALVFYRAGTASVDLATKDLHSEISARTRDAVDRHIDSALRLTSIQRGQLSAGVVALEDPEALLRFFSSSLEAYNEASAAFFGTRDGEFYGARRTAGDEIEVMRSDPERPTRISYYRTDERGAADRLAEQEEDFEPRVRPWYTGATERREASFTPVYADFAAEDLAITASLPVYDHNERLAGVLGVDLLLGRLNQLLQAARAEHLMTLYIVERESGYMVANCELIDNFRTTVADTSARLYPTQTQHDLIRSSWQHLRLAERRADNQSVVEPSWSDGFLIGAVPYRNRNIDWQIVVALDGAPFLARIRTAAALTVAIVAAVLVIAVVAGLYGARRVLAPVESLADAAERITSGDWDVRVEPPGTNELGTLAEAFNTMAGRIHDSVENLEQNVRDRTKELERSNRAKDTLFSIIGHDLRSPISGINQVTEILLQKPSSLDADQRREMVGAIRDSSSSVLNLLEDLLLWARSQRGHIAYDPQPLQLKDLVTQALEPFSGDATEKEITIENEVDPSCMVCADHFMITTVIRNLVSNAMKYTARGGRVGVACARTGERSEVCVTDTGIGIDGDTLEQIFDLGTKSTQPGTEGETGSGFGLALVHEFLEHHGTELCVESSPGQGSRFSFWLASADSGSDIGCAPTCPTA